MLFRFAKLKILTLAPATKVLLLGLFVLSACSTTESYYVSEHGLTIDKTVEPFLISMQPLLFGRKTLKIRISLNPYSMPEAAADGGTIEMACKDIAVLGNGKSLRELKVTCPSGDELLQKKRVEVVFDLPDGPPSKIVVTMPKILVKKSGSNSEEVIEKYSATFFRKDWVHKASLQLH